LQVAGRSHHVTINTIGRPRMNGSAEFEHTGT
jgi:hypothetical protein